MSDPEAEVVSLFFAENSIENRGTKESNDSDISDDFLFLVDELNNRLKFIQIPDPVHCVYNSTEYARCTFEMYVRKYCNTKKPIMYLGMNPGPWGMSQTGVPFGEINFVRDWLLIEGPVGKPKKEIRSRPIQGFQCTRSEVSGKRFWGLIKNICGTPEIFFNHSFVYNYLPQQWMKENGCNITPSDFKVSQMKDLYGVCDPIFAKVLQLYEVKTIVAIGKFCETRAKKVIGSFLPSSSIEIVYLPHPSPRTVNNNDWDKKATDLLRKHNLLRYYENNHITYRKDGQIKTRKSLIDLPGSSNQGGCHLEY